ncbi:FAD-dependent oxidoreductase [Nocardia rhizosphaerihabitans]|uniref:FAD dependent oxidoreductase domain-containing protein n=1 Tax=Nocardia rhizosphaerihabitans TaxID=1691570 RepID=A0ABQ2L3K7_9NOCA|nr:FAD-dependent oxidoreductase [Nocardia rhizosphaerihabitans]GGN99824.1 hypothetical protein GCM10011610_68150 [Nocardia rhizosphaerihabitans]
MVRGNTSPVAVIGSGVLGAAVADELVRRGHTVVILTAKRSRPPVTDSAFGWLSSHGSAAEQPLEARDHDARTRALGALRAVTTRPPLHGLITWSGAVSWASTEAAIPMSAEMKLLATDMDSHCTSGPPAKK